MSLNTPTSIADLNAKITRNTRIEGFGLDVKTISPCPFCGAPDFLTMPLMTVEEAMQENTTCRECGRSGRFLFERAAGAISFEFVQTGGDDVPEWYNPKPRRVES